MAQAPAFQEPSSKGPKTYLAMVLGGCALLGLIWFIYTSWNSVPGVAVEQTPPTAIDMLPPPPPPPPPPEPEEKPPEPTDKPDPTPVPTPTPTPDQPTPAPMQIDGPAQSGSDSFGLTSGSGGGMGAPSSKGTCIGTNCGAPAKTVLGADRLWGRNIANALETHVENSKKVNVDSFVSEYDVWVSTSGVLTRAKLARSSGNAKLDQTVLALLLTARGLKPRPETLRSPQRVKVGRKRF